MVTPATLSVQALPLSTAVQMAVPALNFSDWTQWAATEGAGRIVGAQFGIATLFSNVYSSSSFVALRAPFANASYDQTLYGPSYKCVSLQAAAAAEAASGQPPPWTLPDASGARNTTYTTIAAAFVAELGVPAVHDPRNYSSTIYSASAPPYMFNTILVSAGGTNPRWDGGPAAVINSTTTPAAAGAAPVVRQTLAGPPGSNMVCQLHNTSFDLTLRWDGGVQTIVPRAVRYLEPQAYSSTAGSAALLTGLCRRLANGSLASPADGNCAQAVGTYYVTHLLFAYLLTARLRAGASGGIAQAGGLATVPLLQSSLVQCPDLYNSTAFRDGGVVAPAYRFAAPGAPGSGCRNGTLAAAIEDLSRNFTYSLLTFGGWANYTADAAVTHTQARLVFTYARATLWAAYGAALGATLLAMAVGARALWHNGVVSSTSFSTAVLTTRNPQLDALLGGSTRAAARHALGAQPLDSRVGRLRLRFGYIDRGTGSSEDWALQAGFGLEGTVQPLRNT